MSVDTWTHRIARIAVGPLVGSRVTANHLTACRLVTGLAAVVCFARGTPVWDGWGGILFLLSTFLDRADGELARINGDTSAFGHAFDLISDGLITGFLFIGIALGRPPGLPEAWTLPMGVLAGVCVAASFWFVARIEAIDENGIPSFHGFDPDDIFFLVAPIAWLGGLGWLLIAGFAGTPLCVLVLAWQYNRFSRRARG